MKRYYGLMAMYADLDATRRVAKELKDRGYTEYEVYAPFPDEELLEHLPGKTRIHWVMLSAGLIGCAGAYFMQWYAARDYPINVGGRPIHSWPSFVPVTFELTVLTTAIVGVLTLLWFARLPRLDFPTFNDPRFTRASQDRYFVCFRAPSPAEANVARKLLEPGAESIEEVYA